jgi:EAL domain-containing protein (putative c-di-GMP-specific phosphodiesterase class I)
VNVSANDLADRGVVERISQALGARGEFLTVEITETALMKDTQAILANIELLRAARVQISLDDYGTGYSSLESLKRFAFDEIKIDKTFIDGILQSERNLKLTQASISLGHDLGALVVAEGVEDEDTVALLVQKGCDVLQGYCICRPMPADEFVNFSEDFNRQSVQPIAG